MDPEGTPLTWRLLRAAMAPSDPGYMCLYTEVCRVNPGRSWSPEKLVALSVKIAPGRLTTDRYDAAIHWDEGHRPQVWESVCRAAPTGALHDWLRGPGHDLRAWVAAHPGALVYLAVDHAARVYKVYLFRSDEPGFCADLDPAASPGALRRAAYIDCVELDVDKPRIAGHPLYFKLPGTLADAMDPGWRTPVLSSTLLPAHPERAAILADLQALVAGRPRVNDPVVKLRLAPDAGIAPDTRVAVSANLDAPGARLSLAEAAPTLERVARRLGAFAPTRDWLGRVERFPCFVSYLSVGHDFVAVYYKCEAEPAGA